MTEPHSLIKGRKGGKGAEGSGGGIPPEQPDTLKAVQTAYVVELLSEGEIHGLVNGNQSIFLDGTPLQNSDGSFNFEGFDLQMRSGSPSQAPISGQSDAESEIFLEGVNQITFSTPVTRRILVSPDPPDAIRVKVQLPSLSYLGDAGVLGPTSVDIKISVSVDDGPFIHAILLDTISGKATSPYARAYRIVLPVATQHWDIRVERLTADSEEVRLQNETVWPSYTEIRELKIMYADSAIAGWRIDAEQFGSSIPSRQYELNGRMILVPSNYDTATRTYDEDPTWDGTFKSLAPEDTVCSNPIWVLFDLLTNRRYGLGEFIPEGDIDRFAFYEAAKWCDEQVPNGFRLEDGELDTEPRYSFNGAISGAEDAWTVLSSVAANCHARLYWGPGVISIAIDKLKDPVGLVSRENVVDGELVYASDALRDRHSVINVTWNNPNDGYLPDVERVEDPALIATYGARRTLDVIAPGVTSRSEARRFGKYLLETEKTENQVLTYKAGLDHAGRVPGDIVEVADSFIAGKKIGGRLAAASGDPITFTLNEAFAFDATDSYTISYVTPDGEWVETAITNPGTTTTDEVTSVDTGMVVPNSGAMWTISSTAGGITTRPFTILSVVDLGQAVFEFACVLHNPLKFDAVENDNFEVPDDNYSGVPTGPILPVKDISATLTVSRTGGAAVVEIDVGWTPPDDPRVVFYDVRVKRPGVATFNRFAYTQSVSASLGGISAGFYTFRVFCVDSLGRRSVFYEETFDFSQLGEIPGDVQNFAATVVGGQIHLTWDALDLISLSHYEVRYDGAVVDAIWGASIPLVTGIPPTTTSIFVPKLNGSYLIKAFDIFGQESVNAAIDVVTNVDDAHYNAIGTIQEDPDFAGTKTKCFVNGTDLWMILGSVMADWDPLEDAVPIAGNLGPGVLHQSTYVFDNSFDLGAVYDVRMTGHVKAHVENYFSNFMAGWVSLSQLETLAGIAVNPTTVELYIRTTSDDPGGSPTWSVWKRFTVGTFRGRGFQFKIILKTTNGMYTPAVSELRVSADMQDRTIASSGVSSNTATTSIAFNPEFYSGSTVQVTLTLQDQVQGDYYTISNVDSTGFDVDVYNSVGGRVVRNFSFIAQGWGVKI